jgi:hypothetical protein
MDYIHCWLPKPPKKLVYYYERKIVVEDKDGLCMIVEKGNPCRFRFINCIFRYKDKDYLLLINKYFLENNELDQGFFEHLMLIQHDIEVLEDFSITFCDHRCNTFTVDSSTFQCLKLRRESYEVL